MLYRPVTPFRAILAISLLGIVYLIYTFSADPLASVAPKPHSGTTGSAVGANNNKPHPKPHLRHKIAGDGASEVAVLTMTTKEDSYLWLGLVNKLAYARHHNYDLYMDFKIPKSPDNPDASAVWHKLTMLEYVEPLKYDWIWWTDFDTLVTNMSMRIEDIAKNALADSGLSQEEQNKIDLLVVKDCWSLNAGSLMFRGDSPRLKSYIRAVFKCKKDRPHVNEQDCIRIHLNLKPEEQSQEEKTNPVPEKDRVEFNHLWVPQRILNVYPDEIQCYDKEQKSWKPGMFMIHFAGAWAHLRDEKDAYGYLMRKYKGKVVPPELQEAAW